MALKQKQKDEQKALEAMKAKASQKGPLCKYFIFQVFCKFQLLSLESISSINLISFSFNFFSAGGGIKKSGKKWTKRKYILTLKPVLNFVPRHYTTDLMEMKGIWKNGFDPNPGI